MTLAKVAALTESDEEAVDVSLPRLFTDGSKAISGYFCGNVRRTVTQKPEEMRRAVE